MTDVRQTPEYAEYMRSRGWNVEKVGGVYIFAKRLPLLGSFIKVQRYKNLPLQSIEEAKRRHKAFQVVLEPIERDAEIASGGFRQNSPFSPSKTLTLDLLRPKNSLYKNCAKDCRYALRRTESMKLKALKSWQIKKFRASWKKSAGWKRHVPSAKELLNLKKSFSSSALFVSTNSCSAGGVFLRTRDTGYYWYGFTGRGGRKSLAQYKVVWEGIMWAKKNGCKTFDFEGMYDERHPNKNWLGFTHFKKSFGGGEKVYPGAFSKWSLPIKKSPVVVMNRK